MRSLTLARALAARGCETGFLAAAPGRRLLQAFGWTGPMAALETPGPAGALAAAVADAAREAQIVVVDSYRLGAAEEAPLRASGRRVAVIDDLADRAHACDLLIDAGFERRAADYAGLAPGARVLAGPAYALLRPGFAAARPEALARRDGRPVSRVLVSLGLTDLGGITARAVEALLPVLGEVEMQVLVGEGAASLERLRRLAQADSRLRLQVNAPQVEALMTQADAAIGAGGSSTWERACLGLPALSLILADNQRDMTLRLGQAGVVLAVAADGGELSGAFQRAWARLCGDPGLRMRMSQRGAELCDGAGAERAAAAVMALA